jgi:hypothetical protein
MASTSLPVWAAFQGLQRDVDHVIGQRRPFGKPAGRRRARRAVRGGLTGVVR